MTADGTWSPNFAPKGVGAETDVGNGYRVEHYASDRLRWAEGWKTFTSVCWCDDEPGAYLMAAHLCVWITREAEQMRAAGAPADAVARREDWARESQSVVRIEAALKIARGLLASTMARPASDKFDGAPSIREQVLAAGLHAVAQDDGGLRAESSGRLVAARVAARVTTVSSRLWPGISGPPMPEPTMAKLYSAVFGGDLAAR